MRFSVAVKEEVILCTHIEMLSKTQHSMGNQEAEQCRDSAILALSKEKYQSYTGLYRHHVSLERFTLIKMVVSNGSK